MQITVPLANSCKARSHFQAFLLLQRVAVVSYLPKNRTRSSAQSELQMSVYQYIVILHSCCAISTKWYQKLGRIKIKRCPISWQTSALPLVFETHLSKKWQHQIELLMSAILRWPSLSALSDATAVEICHCMFLTINAKQRGGVQNRSKQTMGFSKSWWCSG